MPAQKNTFAIKIFTVLCVLLLISLGGNAYFAYEKFVLPDPRGSSEEEIAQLIEDVGKVLVLPSDETPTTATVTDPEKLRDQSFFAKAEVGDRVLIYQNTGKAILWRPSEKRVIEVSTINPSNTETPPNYVQGSL